MYYTRGTRHSLPAHDHAVQATVLLLLLLLLLHSF
jgi:hypothetical protein